MESVDPYAHIERQIEELVAASMFDSTGTYECYVKTMRQMLAVVRAAKDDAYGAEANCGKYSPENRDCSAWIERGLRCSDCPVEVWLSSTHPALAKLTDSQPEGDKP